MKNVRDLPMNYDQIKGSHLLPCSYQRYYYITDDMLNDELDEYNKHTTRAECVKRTEKELINIAKSKSNGGSRNCGCC